MKTLKFLILAAIFLAAFSFTAQAQSQSEPESDPYNREIGFGTNILLNTIFNSQSGPLDFVYKWKSGNGYYRVGTSVGYSKNDDYHYSNYHSSNEFLQSNLMFGREWRQNVSNRWKVNYGSDLLIKYRYSLQQSENWRYRYVNGNTRREHIIDFKKVNDHSYGLSVKPFIGVLFMINQRLFLGAEASFSAGFLKRILRESLMLP